MNTKWIAIGCVAAMTLSGCGSRDPFAGVARMSQTPDMAQPADSEDAAVAAALTANLVEPPEERTGGLGRLFGGLFGGGADRVQPEPTPASTAQAEDAPTADTAAEAAPTATPQPARAGFFGRLFGSSQRSQSAPTGETNSTPSARPGGKVPLGQVAKVCDLPSKDRGTRIGSVAGFTLYDTFPNSTAARPFYLTGFGDGCARQVTGALVMFGDPAIHETHLYSARNPRYAEVDTAYEQIKSRVCRVGRGTPCGAKIDRMRRTVAFVTIYPQFETSGTWAELLLQSRKVQAISLRE